MTTHFLKNLDPLRFFAAFFVLCGHVDKALADNRYTLSRSDFPLFTFAGQAVTFFFVLSGFLITFLLLQEKRSGKISIRNFYLKRIFRIWPLYYLVLLLSFLLFNRLPFLYWNHWTNDLQQVPFFSWNMLLLLLVAPNIVLMHAGGLGYATISWSIGIEEQFYLVWPHLVKRKHFMVYLVLLLVVMIFISYGFFAWLRDFLTQLHVIRVKETAYSWLSVLNTFFTYWAGFKIDAMAIGAFLAWLVVSRKERILIFIYHPLFQLLIYLLLGVVFIFNDRIPYQACSLIFGLLIMNLGCNSQSILSLNNRLLNYFGKISYGIYLLHMVTIMPVIHLLIDKMGMGANRFSIALIILLSTLFTISISAFSYRFYESVFLRWIRKRTRIREIKME